MSILKVLFFAARLVRRVVIVAALTAAMMLVAEPLGHADAVSPANRVAVVTANLLEGYDDRDLADMTEMDVAADRILEIVPYYPDVILLQEVRSQSARYLTEVLAHLSGSDYAVAADAGVKPWVQEWSEGKTTVERRETAIIVNRDTMRVVDSGYLRTVLRRGDDVHPVRRSVYHNAYALVRERGTDLTVAATTVHFPLPKTFADGEEISTYKETWSRDLAAELETLAPDAMHVIGGDFNSIRCDGDLGRRSLCEPRAFWTALNDLGYVDAHAWIHPRSKAVDYLFADRHVVDAEGDMEYDKTDHAGFYSDHRFRWALLEHSPIENREPPLYDGRR